MIIILLLRTDLKGTEKRNLLFSSLYGTTPFVTYIYGHFMRRDCRLSLILLRYITEAVLPFSSSFFLFGNPGPNPICPDSGPFCRADVSNLYPLWVSRTPCGRRVPTGKGRERVTGVSGYRTTLITPPLPVVSVQTTVFLPTPPPSTVKKGERYFLFPELCLSFCFVVYDVEARNILGVITGVFPSNTNFNVICRYVTAKCKSQR